MSKPNSTHFRALDRIWKYLNHYNNLGIKYNKNKLLFKGYSDSDWGGDLSSRKSTSGYIFQLGDNIISWNSSLQKTVALSSCEGEYMALRDVMKENIYLNNVIQYLNKILNLRINNSIPVILIDN